MDDISVNSSLDRIGFDPQVDEKDSDDDLYLDPEANSLSNQTSPTFKKVTIETPTLARKRKCLDELNETLQASSINGISQAFSKSKPKYKVFWLLVFIFGVVAFLINLYTITHRYVQHPILTQLEREDQTFTWPDFTFCSPTNPIPFWTNQTLLKKWKEVFRKAETEYSDLIYDYNKNRKIWEHYMSISTINPMEFYRYLVRSTINSMAILYEDSSIVAYSSSMDSFEYVPNFESLFDIKLYTLRSPIACFSLVPERLKKLIPDLRKSDHKLIGIKLYVIMDAKSYMDFDMGFESRKMYFYITEPNSTILSKFPFYILPGTDSSFQIKEKIHKRVAGCTDKQFEFELYDINMVGTWRLRGGFQDCRSFISQENYVNQCGCYNPYLPVYKILDKKPILCTNMSIYDNNEMRSNIACLNYVMNKNRHADKFKTSIRNRCGEFKKKQCIDYTYNVARYTSMRQNIVSPNRNESLAKNIKHLKNFKSYSKIKNFLSDNLAIMRLEWGKEPTEATFEDFEYPFGQYMSDFGGIIGLWVGLSVISVFEFIEIISKLVKYARA